MNEDSFVSIKSHLNMLVQLARADGVVVQEEIDFVKKIAEGFDMFLEEVSECFEDPSRIEVNGDLSNDLRYDFMYNIVQLMKIDGRIYKEEIAYCANIANKLGYEEDVLMELIIKVHSDPHISTDKALLKPKIQTYLENKNV